MTTTSQQSGRSPRRYSVANKGGRRVSIASDRTVRDISKIGDNTYNNRRPDTKLSVRSEEIAFNPGKQVTFSFLYSTSIEKAFRRRYQCTVFGPLSAAAPGTKAREPLLEVEDVEHLYDDFRNVSELLLRNKQFAQKLQEELSVEEEDPGKLVKLPRIAKVKNSRMRSRENSVARSGSPPSFTRFPPIGGTNSVGVTASTNAGNSHSDFVSIV